MRSALGAVEPLNVSQATTDLSLLELLLGHLLLLASAELHIRVVLCAAVDGRADDGACGGGGDDAGCTAGWVAGVFEAVEAHSRGATEGDHAVLDVPLLGAKSTDEFFVVGNQNDTTLEVANGDGQTTKGVTVQEVSGFVEHQQVRVVPHGSGNDDLNLLTTGQRANFVVVGNFRVQTEIFKVLGNDGGLELTVTETFAGGFVIIEFLDQLDETEFNEGFTRNLVVVLGQQSAPFAAKLISIIDGQNS